MELFPRLIVGWLNGWVAIICLGLVDGILFLVFPEKVLKRLWDRSGWSQKQQLYTVAGKLCALGCLVLITFTSLKIGRPVFAIGSFLVAIGLIGLVKALLDFKNTSLVKPVTGGLYRISRHPQIVMSSLVILGACIAIGSWIAIALWFIARLLEHFGILAEEEVCLKQYGESYRHYMEQVPRYLIIF
jgi:protein-S-isoprenylcysteine O-methyltransferase Ste14